MLQHPFPTTSTGVIYPTNYVTAVLDDLKEAEEACQALQQAGFPAEDIVLVPNPELLEIMRTNEQRQTIWNKIMLAVSSVVSDEGQYHVVYADAAKTGHHLLNVYAPQKEERVERAYRHLKDHGGHLMRYFGKWTITTLP